MTANYREYVERRRRQGRKAQEAAALRYDPERDSAPNVAAAGRGAVAQRIVELARGAGVPVYKDEKLARALSQLRVGEQIPQELYQVVAEVLAYIARMDSGYGKARNGGVS